MRKLLAILMALALLTGTRALAQNVNPVSYTNGTITGACAPSSAATGSCPAGSFISLNPGNYVGIRFLISAGTAFVATLQLYVAPVGACSTFQPITFIQKSVGDGVANSTTSAGLYDSNGMNACNAMLVATSYTSGTVTATLTAGPADVAFNASSSAGSVSVNNFPTDGLGNLKVAEQNVLTVAPSGGAFNVAGQGTAGAPSGGVLSVQGVASGTAIPISGSITCASGCAAVVPWTYYTIPASALCVSAPCVIKNSAAVFGGIINESTSAQPTGNCTWYDNASAASGNVLYIETTIGAGQVVTMPYPGTQTTNGIVVQCAANPGGSGIVVMFR